MSRILKARQGWRTASLEDLVFFQRGYDITKSEQRPGDIPVISSSGINSYHSESKVDGPGVVIGRKGSLGTIHYVEGPYWPHDTTLWSKDIKGNHARFVYYFLHTLGLEHYDVGNSNPTLNRNHIHGLAITIPEYRIQERIASILSAYDDLIENNRRRIQLLEQAARLLYKEWFVRLRFPGHEHVKVKDGGPEGWERRTFGEVAKNFDRFRVPLSILERENRAGPYPYYGAAGILSHIDDFLFDGRFLLIGEDGTVCTPSGSAMLQFVEGRFWVSNHAHVIQGRSVTTEFLYCFMSHYSIQPHITGVAQPKLSQRNLNRIELLTPSTQLQSLFQRIVSPLLQQVFTLKSQISTLMQARDLLLPRLMSGVVVMREE